MPYSDPQKRKKHNAEYGRRHYAENKEEYISRAGSYKKSHRESVKEFIWQAKSKPCADCKKQYPPYVMHFDHLRDKEFHIGSALSGSYSMKRIAAEMEKCEVVCANCHAIRTHNRRKK